MRSARLETFHEREELPLASRGPFARTFFGMGLFAATSLFLCGAYLLCGAMLDPLGATDMAVIVAGFALALATFILVFLAWSRGKQILQRRHESSREPVYPSGPVLAIYGQTVQDGLQAKRTLSESKALPRPM
jgi:hypothetical protein